MRSPRSRASQNSEPPDAYTAALVMLGQREFSEAQLRTRLARRGCEAEAIDDAMERLTRDRTLDDGRVARAAARLEAGIRHRGPARVRQRLQSMGLAADLIQKAISEAFEEVDESALLDAAFERRLQGRDVAGLDDQARARLVRGLVGQGFSFGDVLRKVRK